MPQMGYRTGPQMVGRLVQTVGQSLGQGSFLGQNMNQVLNAGRKLINRAQASSSGSPPPGPGLPNEAPGPQRRGGENMLNAPGSQGAGRVVDQATLANYMAQAAKDRWSGDFNKAITALAIHPMVDSNRAKEIMPKYVQAFNTMIESGFGRDVRPAMQGMLQHFFDSALGARDRYMGKPANNTGGNQNGG